LKSVSVSLNLKITAEISLLGAQASCLQFLQQGNKNPQKPTERKFSTTFSRSALSAGKMPALPPKESSVTPVFER
jgi:hypothetical protein